MGGKTRCGEGIKQMFKNPGGAVKQMRKHLGCKHVPKVKEGRKDGRKVGRKEEGKE